MLLHDRAMPIKKTENVNSQEIKCGIFAYALLSKGINNQANENNRIAILEKLLEKGADINEVVTGGAYSGCSALSMAAIHDETEVVEFLISKDADLNKKDSIGKTALFYALEAQKETGNEKIVNALLKAYDYKIDDIRSTSGETLLMYFCKYGKFEQLNSFLPNMVNANESVLSRTDNNGLTPFLYAAAYNHDYRIMKLLRMYGADVQAKDKNGKNAFVLAKENGNTSENENSSLRLGGYWGRVMGLDEPKRIPKENISDENAALRIERDSLKKQLKAMKNALAEAKRDANSERAKYELELKTLRMEHRELSDLRELVFNSALPEEERDRRERVREEIAYPYQTRKRTVIFGGSEAWLKAIRPMFPGVRFVDPDNYVFNPDIVRNADVVWIQNNCISHTQFGKIVGITRRLGIQLRYFCFAGAEKCAEQLVTEDQK